MSDDDIVNLSAEELFKMTPLIKAATKAQGENSLNSKMGSGRRGYDMITIDGKPTMHRGGIFLCVAYNSQTMPPWNEMVVDETRLRRALWGWPAPGETGKR